MNDFLKGRPVVIVDEHPEIPGDITILCLPETNEKHECTEIIIKDGSRGTLTTGGVAPAICYDGFFCLGLEVRLDDGRVATIPTKYIMIETKRIIP